VTRGHASDSTDHRRCARNQLDGPTSV
jgi:hypothetical protein